ncbi:hypothetical protein [Blastococcus saxobsidens]|uniref:Uncharacterized protein n=1 Tax=Blastococcus saxobsidens (strain DD2) TaxID=1146883 RepID=H6RLV8_BLASD|nr:hypothetical protein [Blastococcus saxobsidens]CCG05037.1 conserved membrane protein of unknown function [Blastococcus saxobsidens DD2]
MTEREQAYTGATAPVYSDRPVAFRGPESLGGLLLILAGIAAALSLLLDWLRNREDTGWTLVRDAVRDLDGVFDDGGWQPLAIVFGGGVLLVLGVLLWLPARTHRFLGFVALLVSGVVTAAVIVPLAEADWEVEAFGPGLWCAIAVAVLGLLGSLKALLTGPRYPR